MERLPGNTKNRLFTRSWTARVRFLHPWADSSPIFQHKNPIFYQKTFTYHETSPLLQKSPISCQKRPICNQRSHIYCQKSPSVLQCAAVCCSVLQCAAVCCHARPLQCATLLKSFWSRISYLKIYRPVHCNTLQHTQHTITHCNTLSYLVSKDISPCTLQHTATHATHYRTLQHTVVSRI